jgi:hypothetical protein
MPLLTQFDLGIEVDQVLRAQGADPAKIRERSPRLVDTAEKAIDMGAPLLEPKVLYQEFEVDSLRHERFKLSGGGTLSGKLISQHMAPAEKMVAILCTVGSKLEEYSSKEMASNPVLGLALAGVGSAAVELIANNVCAEIEHQYTEDGLQATIPLSPGMVGWTVEEAQPQIFNLLNGEDVGVSLTSSYVMIPRKSLTMVLGAGRDIHIEGSTCDYCSMRETCQYKDHYG